MIEASRVSRPRSGVDGDASTQQGRRASLAGASAKAILPLKLFVSCRARDMCDKSITAKRRASCNQPCKASTRHDGDGNSVQAGGIFSLEFFLNPPRDSFSIACL